MKLPWILDELWRRDPALATGGWLMVAGLIVATAAAPFDNGLITGVNPWIKPMKFFASIGIFLWTVAWFMPETDTRLARRVTVIRWTILLAMSVEMALIAMQAARGTTSHFNVRSFFDATVFNVMGVMIVLNTIAVGVLLTTLRRITSLERAAYLWGVRLGLGLFVLGSLTGFFMVANMGHSVPGPDGGPGLPFVNWSTTAGDLRVAHFVGLHALQIVPLVGYLLDRRGQASPAARAAAVSALAAAWLVVVLVVLGLAFQGRPLIAL